MKTTTPTNTVVRTRVAPSPTGELHVGSLAILLKNYAFAKKHGGQFVVRIEDTDKVREVENGVAMIMQVIKDYGLSWDEGPEVGGPYGPYIQSQRIDIYKKYALELIESGKAYYCFATKEELEAMREEAEAEKRPPRYNGMYREYPVEKALERIAAGEEYVIRLKVPSNREIVFTDLLRGEVRFSSNEIDDQVLLKSDGYPTYHLAVVVDDHLMQITHIMRGEEWISSTPKHILLYEAFGWPLPVYAHIPVFLNPDGKGKMSKRKGTVSARSFLERGYLPEAVLNFLMILGWSSSDQREVLSLDEYIAEFEPTHVSHNSVAFDYQKLNWLNGVYIRSLSDAALHSKLLPFLPSDFPSELLDTVLPLIKDRLVTLADIAELTEYFYKPITVSAQLLIDKKATPELVAHQLQLTSQVLSSCDWSVTELETTLRNVQHEQNWHPRQYFMMLRLATTARTATPPLFDTFVVMGKEQVLARLTAAHYSILNAQ